jgi:uncharacterized protein
MRPAIVVPAGLAVAGASLLGYGAGYEVRSFRLRTVELPVLPRGERPLRILHLSDLHLTPGQLRKKAWVQGLASLRPDLVVNTGDNLSHPDAVPTALSALEPLLEFPGVFVFGSNDYFAPVMKNPLRYFWPSEPRIRGGDLPWEALRDGMTSRGWTDLTNVRSTMTLDGRNVEFVGVDDPHIRRDRYDTVAGPPDSSAALTIGVVHAPYRRVLDRMSADGFPVILAGHTHGGQVCVPFLGALVTNCDLDTSRAKGASRWPDAACGSTWLHVSAGLGTSRYAPIRFACPPEATLVTLVPVIPQGPVR